MSAATIHSNMRAAFRAALLQVAGLPPQANFAWEGRVYRPRTGTPYIRESFRSISSRPRALGAGGTIEHRMMGNLVLVYPPTQLAEVEAAAGALLLAFRPGRSLVYQGASGFVMASERGGLISEPDWLSCPVTIEVTAYTTN